jgi:hypothetical protein
VQSSACVHDSLGASRRLRLLCENQSRFQEQGIGELGIRNDLRKVTQWSSPIPKARSRMMPWEERVKVTVDETAIAQMETGWAVRIAVSSSARNGIVGMGGVVRIPLSMYGGPRD